MSPTRRRAAVTLTGCFAALALCLLAALWLVRPRASAVVTAEVSVGGTVASVCVPEQPAGAPLVILCHGFTGNREGDGHFAPLAQALARRGVATIRPDFPGCGGSPLASTDSTLSAMQYLLNTCVELMRTDYGVDTSRLALVGHSMGGRLASLYAAPDPGRYPVCALALWSPANGDGLRGLEFLDIEEFARVEALAAEAAANGAVTAWNFTMSSRFFEEMAASAPNDALRAYGGPVLLCYTGSEGILSDETRQQTIDTVSALGGTVLTEPFAEASHNYIAADRDRAAELDPELDRALRDATEAFLLAQLGADGS